MKSYWLRLDNFFLFICQSGISNQHLYWKLQRSSIPQTHSLGIDSSPGDPTMKSWRRLCPACLKISDRMEVLRRSSVFAAEVMEVFDRTPTDKELVSQAKVLCRDYIHSRLIRAGIGWNKPEHSSPVPVGKLAEVSSILLRLGKYKNGRKLCLAR